LFPYFLICQRTFLLSNKTSVLITNQTYTSIFILCKSLSIFKAKPLFNPFCIPLFLFTFPVRLCRFGVAKVIKFLLLTSFCENIFELYFRSFRFFNPSLFIESISVLIGVAKVIKFLFLTSFFENIFKLTFFAFPLHHSFVELLTVLSGVQR